MNNGEIDEPVDKAAIDYSEQYGDRPDFYLRQLTVKGFRVLKDATFSFNPGLNVIVGPNNGGKSALIDALRLLFSIGTYEEKEDFIRIGHKDVSRLLGDVETATVSLEATFHGRKDTDVPGMFYDIDANETCDDDEEYGVFQLRYQVNFGFDEIKKRFGYKSRVISGGKDFVHPVSAESLDYMKSIYLEPLRDLGNDRKRIGIEIERLLYGHGDHEKLKDIPSELKDKARELLEQATDGNKHESAAGKSFAKYASAYKFPDNVLHFAPTNLNDELLRSLEAVLEHGIHGASKLNLSSNGLGINNLIYSSIVLSRTNEERAHVHRFFLIEEPEAHLHPQLQDSFFQELNKITAHQIFVTSHSPTITAKSDVEKIIVMSHPQLDIGGQPYHLSRIVKDEDKRYLHKFLDVTRSQLLFANSVIFVEGVTEALLLERFSEMIGYGLRENGVEIVILGAKGGFSHFEALFSDSGLPLRCAFITDDDAHPDSMPATATDLVVKTETTNVAGTETLKTFKGLGTFEFELLLSAFGNESMQSFLIDSLSKARNSSDDNVTSSFVSDYLDFSNPLLSYKKMKQKSTRPPAGKSLLVDDTEWSGNSRTNSAFLGAKSDYAYYLYCALLSESDQSKFTVPKYIRDAIEFVVMPNHEEESNTGVADEIDDRTGE